MCFRITRKYWRNIYLLMIIVGGSWTFSLVEFNTKIARLQKVKKLDTYTINIPIVQQLAQLVSVLRSIHRSGELKRCITWTGNMLWPSGHDELGMCLIRKSQDLAYVVQHDFGIKAFNKDNELRQFSKLSLNMCLHSRSYPSNSRYKHYASR